MYNRQEFMTRFVIQLPIRSKDEYIEQVKQIFVCVQARVQAAVIERIVKKVRVKKRLGLLELNPVMKRLEKEEAYIALFKKLGEIIPEVADLLYSPNFSLKAKKIRAWMQDNPEKLHTVTRLSFARLGLAVLPPEIGLLINLKTLSLASNQLKQLPESINQLINLKILSLASNQLTQLPESINQLINLNRLVLVCNQLTTLPPCLRTLSNEGKLICGGNPVCALPEDKWFGDI
jgi:hypothetical protein